VSTGVKADKIYLVGFMAAGKTTVARALAGRLDWQAVDIDELIEKREHQSVADIFAKQGEAYFRSLERQVLLAQIGPRHLVVATGGGTFADVQNRAAINNDGVSVWLDVPLDRLVGRVPVDGRRPLAADRAGFERLYHQRRAAYEQAHVRLDAGRASVDALVEQLVDWLEH
jgi:shikimate kinase